MANEQIKNFNVMLHDSKDMPKIQIITDEKSIAKYGGDRMYFALPIAYDSVMRNVSVGKVTTVGAIRAYLLSRTERILLSRSPRVFLFRLRHGQANSGRMIRRRTGERSRRMES